MLWWMMLWVLIEWKCFKISIEMIYLICIPNWKEGWLYDSGWGCWYPTVVLGHWLLAINSITKKKTSFIYFWIFGYLISNRGTNNNYGGSLLWRMVYFSEVVPAYHQATIISINHRKILWVNHTFEIIQSAVIGKWNSLTNIDLIAAALKSSEINLAVESWYGEFSCWSWGWRGCLSSGVYII